MDLFGKKKQEERIHVLESSILELQKEKEELMSTLKKRDDKIRKLNSAYQEANLALKQAEKKAIASPTPLASFSSSDLEEQNLKGTKMSLRETESILKSLESCRSTQDDLITAYIADIEGALPEAWNCTHLAKSKRGWIFFKSPQLFTLLFIPPFPVKENISSIDNVFQLDILKEMLDTPVLVISAHSGDTFFGVALSKDRFEVLEFVESQVKEKHSKGGWSQKRFERLREEDIKNHVDAVLEKLSVLEGRYRSMVRFAICGGDEILLKQIIPAISLPVIEKRMERHDEKRPSQLLEEVYGFTCYHI